MLRLVMKVWCLVYKEKNMNNEKNLQEHLCLANKRQVKLTKDFLDRKEMIFDDVKPMK